MKKYHLLIVLISLCFVKSPAQGNQKIENVDCDKVVLTKNPEDVKGLQRIGEIEIKAQKFYGSQASLRNKARATAIIGLMNLTYNMYRSLVLTTQVVG